MLGLEKIRNMSVTWFSFNLATSAVALSTFAIGIVTKFPFLFALTKFISAINTVVFIIIAVLYTIRVLLVRSKFIKELMHPMKGPMMSVIGIATMVLAIDWGLVFHNMSVAFLFFISGAIIHTVFFVIILYAFIVHPGLEVQMMNAGWYMPAVGNVLVPYVGSMFGHMIPPSVLGIYLGTGVIMWLALFAIWLYRSLFHSPPPSEMWASAWINFAPPSVAALSYEALLGLGPREFHKLMMLHNTLATKLALTMFNLFYYTFWGLAGLLLPVVIVVTLHYWRTGQLRFATSWYASVFPLAAYVIATVHLFMHSPGEIWLVWYAEALYALMWFFYVVVTTLSLIYGLDEIRGKTPPPVAEPLE